MEQPNFTEQELNAMEALFSKQLGAHSEVTSPEIQSAFFKVCFVLGRTWAVERQSSVVRGTVFDAQAAINL